jgi:hypothetical protein
VAKLEFDLKKLAPVTVAVLSAAVAMAAVTYISFVHQAEQFIRDLETASLSRPEPQSTDITTSPSTSRPSCSLPRADRSRSSPIS